MIAIEKHYRIKELAGLWGLSAKTIARLFADEPGVIRLANGGIGKRKYVTLSIPESAALRVHERLSHETLQALPAGVHPLGVEKLRHLYARMSKEPGNIVKLKAG
jgi:hypothetical protein